MLKSVLSSHKKIVDSELGLFFDKKIKQNKNSFLKYNYSLLKEYVTRPGKRVRPISMLVACAGFSKINSTSKKICIAPELLHCSSLIHDDIMDQDLLRRNKPSMHVQFEKYAKKTSKGTADHKLFGTSLAIMQGNILYSLAFENILESNLSEKVKKKAMNILNSAYQSTNRGQMLDVSFPLKNSVLQREYIEMISGKTADPFAASIEFGALVGGASKNNRTKLWKYGEHLGVAFQIIDDVLDLTTKKGRGFGSDIKKGTKTLPIIHALSNSDGKNRLFLQKTLGDSTTSSATIAKFIKILKNCGGIDSSLAFAQKQVALGNKQLASVRMKKESKEFFFALSEYVLKRKQ